MKKINFSLESAVERKGNANFFRLNTSPYGFNGMEGDDEVKGAKGSSYNTRFRQYDPRVGRWLSQDPLNQFDSPYVGVGNNPIKGSDTDGGWWFERHKGGGRHNLSGGSSIRVTNYKKIIELDNYASIPVLGAPALWAKTVAAAKDPSFSLSKSDVFAYANIGFSKLLKGITRLSKVDKIILEVRSISLDAMIDMIVNPEYKEIIIEGEALGRMDKKEAVWNGKSFDLGVFSFDISTQQWTEGETASSFSFLFNAGLRNEIKKTYWNLELSKLKNGQTYDALNDDDKSKFRERVRDRTDERLQLYFLDTKEEVRSDYEAAELELKSD